MPTLALEFRLPQVGPRGRRRLDLVGIVGEADDLEERRRAHRLLRFGNEVLVVRALLDRERLDEILPDGHQRRTWIMQHHVDRRIGARRLYFCDLVDRQHRVEHDRRIGVRLAEGRHQHRLVGLLPASRECRENQRAGLGVA